MALQIRAPGPFGAAIGGINAPTSGVPGNYQPGPKGYRWLYDDNGGPKGNATKAKPRSFKMPGPAGHVSMARSIDWPLYASGGPKFEDVVQGGLANCAAAALLAALAHTASGRQHIQNMILEHGDPAVTDLKDAVDKIDTPPSGSSISSRRYFTVNLTKPVDVTDVFYTDDADENFNTTFMHPPQNGDRVLWACVIEKACAVTMGGYENVDALTPVDAWRLLMGSDPKILAINDKTDLGAIGKIATAATQVPTVAASKEEPVKGSPLENWHGYAVLGMKSSTVELYDPFDKMQKLTLAEMRKYLQALLYQ